MKKIIYLAMLGGVLAAAPVTAQTVYDAANVADKELNGTARFVGMGGAMGALGGDISTMSTNPAGIGIYRSNDWMTTLGLSAYGTESRFQGNKMSSDKMRMDFNNIGAVFSTKIGNATNLRYVNFGFNYRKAKSFYNNMEMKGNIKNFSQTYQMAWQAGDAGGIDNWGDYPYDDPEIGWLSAIGYDGRLISDLTTNALNGNDEPNLPYKDKNGNHIKDVDGNLLYREPGMYWGMYDNANATFRSEERGGVDEYDFNIAFNVGDRFYFGATLGTYVVDYRKYTYYSETYTGEYVPENYHLQSWNKVKGTGVDFKLGAIVRPLEDSPLRIGLAIHTPTFYNLDYKTSAYLESDVYNVETGKIDQWAVDTRDQLPGSGDMVRRFNLNTPWTYNLSLGYTLGQSLALGAEYEYQDFSSIKFKSPDGYSSEFDFENSTTAMLNGVSTLRLGAEYKVIPEFALRAGYNYRSSIFKEDAFKDLPYYSIQTDTDFSNKQAQNTFTLGVGYRGKMLYADLAYKYSAYKSEFYPFINPQYDGEGYVDPGIPELTKVTNTRSQVLLTVGIRF